MEALFHGILLALGLILPLGAQNVFVFNQGANHKSLLKSFPVIITAGLCDTLLILLAIFGVSLVLISIPTLQLIIYIIGFIFLIYMAINVWREKPNNIEKGNALSPKKQIGFATSVSLLNPHAIMDTIGVIGTSATVYVGTDKLIFTIATIAVSWIWFIFLAIAGNIVKSFDSTGKLIFYINKVSSIIILIVAGIILKNIIQLLN